MNHEVKDNFLHHVSSCYVSNSTGMWSHGDSNRSDVVGNDCDGSPASPPRLTWVWSTFFFFSPPYKEKGMQTDVTSLWYWMNLVALVWL